VSRIVILQLQLNYILYVYHYIDITVSNLFFVLFHWLVHTLIQSCVDCIPNGTRARYIHFVFWNTFKWHCQVEWCQWKKMKYIIVNYDPCTYIVLQVLISPISYFYNGHWQWTQILNKIRLHRIHLLLPVN
jgi:hypothetical protein